MSYQKTGFTDPLLGGIGLRKPNEGEFKAVLPGAGLPLPFKEPAITYELVLSDTVHENYADSLEVVLETPSVTFADGDVIFQDEDVIFEPHEQLLSIQSAVNEQHAGTPTVTIDTTDDVIAPVDTYQENYGGVVSLEQEQNLVASNSDVVNAADVLGLSQEQTLEAANAFNAQLTDSVNTTQEHIVSPVDSLIQNVGDTVTLSTTADDLLAVADSTIANHVEEVNLSQEQALSVDSTYNVNAADSFALVQEHNLNVDNTVSAVVDETIGLTVTGEQIVNADDSYIENDSGNIVLSVSGGAVATKPRLRFPRVYYPVMPEKEKEKEEELEQYFVHWLMAKSSAVKQSAETVDLLINVGLEVVSQEVSSNDNANVIVLTQARRKRFVQEDEILLMAA